MNRRFLLLLSFCVVLIASSAYGGQLPESIKSQYSDCYELKSFYRNDEPTSSSRSSSHSHSIDNLCMDLDKSTYHLLSSAQGGTTSLIIAPISQLTVIYMSRNTLEFFLNVPSQPTDGFRCIFQDPAHILVVYNSIYQQRDLARTDITTGRIQEFQIDPDTGKEVLLRTIISPQTVVFTSTYDNTKIILTFKEERENGGVGNTVLVLMARGFNISDVLGNNNVVIRHRGGFLTYYIVTFRDNVEANRFCNSLSGYFYRNKLVSIPSALQEFLDIVMSIFQE